MKITTYHASNTHIAFKYLIEYFGNVFIEPPELTNEMLRQGFAQSPEYACLPYKLFQGFFDEAIARGAEGLFFFGASGIRACRFNDITEGYLDQHPDKKFKIIYWGGQGGIFSSMERMRELAALGNKFKKPPNYVQLVYAGIVFTMILDAVDEVECLANYYRPRVKDPGAVESWLKRSLKRLNQVHGQGDLSRARKMNRVEVKSIEIDREKIIPRVLLAGDLFKIHDDFFHFDTIRRTARLGIEVQRAMDISDLLRGQYNVPLAKEKSFAYRQKLARPYLERNPAAYTDVCVGDAVHYCQTGVSGIIHFQSFNCMPDILVAPILDKIAKKYNVPIMHYLRDEHASDVGYQTRLEAFADLVKSRKYME